jgi:hypothetical protein
VHRPRCAVCPRPIAWRRNHGEPGQPRKRVLENGGHIVKSLGVRIGECRDRPERDQIGQTAYASAFSPFILDPIPPKCRQQASGCRQQASGAPRHPPQSIPPPATPPGLPSTPRRCGRESRSGNAPEFEKSCTQSVASRAYCCELAFTVAGLAGDGQQPPRCKHRQERPPWPG